MDNGSLNRADTLRSRKSRNELLKTGSCSRELQSIALQAASNSSTNSDSSDTYSGSRMLLNSRNNAPSSATDVWWKRFSREGALDLLFLVFCLVVFASLEAVHPRNTFIIKQTLYKHSYPYKDNTVPTYSIPLYALVLPILVFTVDKVFVSKRAIRDLYRVTLALVYAVILTAAITNCLKVSVGRLRPNFVVRCWPDGNLSWQPGDSQFGGYANCSTSQSTVDEHRKSFPSGHSSWAASGLGFLTYWLLGQTHAFTSKGGRAWRFVLSLTPALGALVIGVSRITDYWHHVSDVCVGLGIGFVVAFVIYRQLFPWWFDPNADAPLYHHVHTNAVAAACGSGGRAEELQGGQGQAASGNANGNYPAIQRAGGRLEPM